jgi:sulfite exporter TauE/SafE
MGMCGPLVAGVCSGPREGVSYQVGRTASYGALGALSGGVVALGTGPLAAGPVAALTSAAMAIGLLWAALRLVKSAWPAAAAVTTAANDESSGLVSLRVKPPRSSSSSAAPVQSAASPSPGPGSRWARMARPVLGSPLLVGVLSALLPCAALLNLGLVAAGSGGVATGAATGVAFATVTGGGLATSAWAAMLLRQTRAGSLVVATVLVMGAAIVSVRAYPQFVGGDAAQDAPACHTEPLAHGAGVAP